MFHKMEHHVLNTWERSLELHQVIRAARERAGLTLTEAADRLGVGKATLSRLETGKGPVTATRLTEIARLYGLMPSTLLDGTIKAVPTGEEDYRDVCLVVEEIERIIDETGSRPAPEKIGVTVVEILKLARAEMRDKSKTQLDLGRYEGIARALLG